MKIVGYYQDDDTYVPLKGDAKAPNHFIECPGCGAWVDCRDLDQVLHHVKTGHQKPVPN